MIAFSPSLPKAGCFHEAKKVSCGGKDCLEKQQFFLSLGSMNIFDTHANIVSDYATYISSFIKIADPKIRDVVETELKLGKLWPEPLLQFNPSFEILGSIDQVAGSDSLHPDIRHIFSG